MVQIISQYVKRQKSQLQQFNQLFRQGFSNTEVHPQERGSVVVLVALALTGLLGLCALVTDVGLIYAEKAHLQNSVDAAALAGAQELTGDRSQVEQKARDYASQNGVSEVTINIAENNSEVIVQATQQVPTSFARIWGINEKQISVSARVMMVPPTGLSGAAPLSIQEQDLVYRQKYVLKTGAGVDSAGWYLDDSKNNSAKKLGDLAGTAGWFGPLQLTGEGSDTYESDLVNGYAGTLHVGQTVNVKHGNMSGPTIDGINTRLSSDTSIPRNTIDSFERNAPEILYVPIVRIASQDGSFIHEVQIVGFAAFFVEGVAGNGNESIVTGWFVKTIVPNGNTSASLSDLLMNEQDTENGVASSDFGIYSPKLIAN